MVRNEADRQGERIPKKKGQVWNTDQKCNRKRSQHGPGAVPGGPGGPGARPGAARVSPESLRETSRSSPGGSQGRKKVVWRGQGVVRGVWGRLRAPFLDTFLVFLLVHVRLPLFRGAFNVLFDRILCFWCTSCLLFSVLE